MSYNHYKKGITEFTLLFFSERKMKMKLKQKIAGLYENGIDLDGVYTI